MARGITLLNDSQWLCALAICDERVGTGLQEKLDEGGKCKMMERGVKKSRAATLVWYIDSGSDAGVL